MRLIPFSLIHPSLPDLHGNRPSTRAMLRPPQPPATVLSADDSERTHSMPKLRARLARAKAALPHIGKELTRPVLAPRIASPLMLTAQAAAARLSTEGERVPSLALDGPDTAGEVQPTALVASRRDSAASDASYVQAMIDTLESHGPANAENMGRIQLKGPSLIDGHFLPNDIKKVGVSKMLGVVNLESINQVLKHEIEGKFHARGISTVSYGLMSTGPGSMAKPSFFVYDAAALNIFLARPDNLATLQAAGWPSEAKAFVNEVASNTVRNNKALYDLIAFCFDDPRPEYQARRVDLAALRATAASPV